MGHTHDHHHDPSAYYTEQLCTVAFCGAFGGIAVAIYVSGLVNNVLAQGILQYSLLAGGIVLLVLVACRAVALWVSVGPGPANHEHHEHDCCDHDHEHEHAHEVTTATQGLPLVSESASEHHHDHEHSHGDGHGHSHAGHDHDHGWAPVRYIVLLVPVLLYFFVPLDALTTARGYGGPIDPEWANAVKATGDEGELAFKELDGAADDPNRRKYYDGKIARIVGLFVPSADARQFSLVRFRITCCAADARALPFPILVNDRLAKDLPPEQRVPDAPALKSKWVEVICQIQFRQHPNQPNQWVTILVVQPTKTKPITDLIKQMAKPPANPYL